MSYSKTLGTKLNNVLESIYRAEHSFEKASKVADNFALKNFFLEKAVERCRFGHELKTEMMNFNPNLLENVGSAGTLHQGWMDRDSLFSINRSESMFSGAIVAEKTLLDQYRGALVENGLPISIEAIIRQQMNKITNDLDIVERLGGYRNNMKIAQ